MVKCLYEEKKNAKFHSLWQHREKTNVSKTALLQALRIHDLQRSQCVSERIGPRTRQPK